MTVAEAAEKLGWSRQYVRRKCQDGTIGTEIHGKYRHTYKVNEQAVKKWLPEERKETKC